MRSNEGEVEGREDAKGTEWEETGREGKMEEEC